MLRILLVLLLMPWMIFAPVSLIGAGEPGKESVAPTTNQGKKWRIGYVEGGPYQDYLTFFQATLDGLGELGWIEKSTYPPSLDGKETRTLWSWLASEARSGYLEFVPDAYWSAGWDQETRQKNKDAIITRLNHKKDLDLMLAFGTKAGLDLVNGEYSVPAMVISASDPVEAGMVKSAEDSGYDHIHVTVEPNKYERQLHLFHEIIKFKKLGLAYDDSPTGRSYAALEHVRKVAADRGFVVLECHTLAANCSQRESEDSVVACCEKLAPQVDAFYITIQRGVTIGNLPRMLEPFFKSRVVTFSQSTAEEVKHGVLMSLAQEDYQNLGRFEAKILARILNGEKPRHLPQVFEDTQEIAINLEAAKRIGFRFPVDVLAGAQEVYESIAPDNETR